MRFRSLMTRVLGLVMIVMIMILSPMIMVAGAANAVGPPRIFRLSLFKGDISDRTILVIDSALFAGVGTKAYSPNLRGSQRSSGALDRSTVEVLHTFRINFDSTQFLGSKKLLPQPPRRCDSYILVAYSHFENALVGKPPNDSLAHFATTVLMLI